MIYKIGFAFCSHIYLFLTFLFNYSAYACRYAKCVDTYNVKQIGYADCTQSFNNNFCTRTNIKTHVRVATLTLRAFWCIVWTYRYCSQCMRTHGIMDIGARNLYYDTEFLYNIKTVNALKI